MGRSWRSDRPTKMAFVCAGVSHAVSVRSNSIANPIGLIGVRPESYPRRVPDLILYARNIPTVFDLLGHDENDMTRALGWGLARNAALLHGFVAKVATNAEVTNDLVGELQMHDETDRGFTDIELRSPGLHVIVEAKRGWSLPAEAQLR